MTEVMGHVEQQFAADPATEHAQFAITPEYVNTLAQPTDYFLCPLEANVYGIGFYHFVVRSLDEGAERVLAERGSRTPVQVPPPVDDSSRFIQYHFGPDFLNYQTVGTTLDFTNGQYPLHNFRMVERHYFRNQLIQSYDFEMPFVIPNTTNTWEMIYSKPWLNDEWKQVMRECPWETKSDSFYFVNGQLVMHNRADYSFLDQPGGCSSPFLGARLAGFT